MTGSLHTRPRPQLSVVTVCLNAPNLERTCESIVNQSFQDFEWIVIDGGSNEETLTIFEKYQHRMEYFVSEPDGGIYFGMNKGIERATGEWLNFMNAGDWYASGDVLHRASETLKGRPDTDVLYGEVYLGASEKCITTDTPPDNLNEFFFHATICHQAAFIRRECFIRYGQYDVSLKIASDHKLFIILCKNNANFAKFDCIVAHSDPSSSVSTPEKLLKERKAIIDELYSHEEIQFFTKTRQKPLQLFMRCLRNNVGRQCNASTL